MTSATPELEQSFNNEVDVEIVAAVTGALKASGASHEIILAVVSDMQASHVPLTDNFCNKARAIAAYGFMGRDKAIIEGATVSIPATRAAYANAPALAA